MPQVLGSHLPAPGRHARSLDAMLDDPESTGRLDRHLAQIGRCRIQAGAQFGGLPARRKVTTHAHRVVVAGALTNACGVTEIRNLQSVRAYRNGALKIGRASCRESVCQYVSISVGAGTLKKKKNI